MLLKAFLLICLHPSVPVLSACSRGSCGDICPWDGWEGDAAPRLGPRPGEPLCPSAPGCSSGDNAVPAGWIPAAHPEAELMEQRRKGEGSGAAERALVATQGLLSSKGQKAAHFAALQLSLSSVISQNSEVCQRILSGRAHSQCP